MSDIKKTYAIPTLPGIRRDGTELDGDYYNDGQWVRFQRGRPKKMGGFQRITNQLSGPVRNALVWSRESMNAVYTFSSSGIEMTLVDGNGTGSSVVSRTPVGFTGNAALTNWTVATQYDAAVGSQATVVLAHASSSLDNIDSTAASKPYYGVASANAAFTTLGAVTGDAPAVSGGVFSIAPYALVYGSDGFLAWSDINQPTIWYTSTGNIGDAGAARVTGAKIVRGLPLRSGSGPAGLLWSLDSVVRMDYLGTSSTWRFSHLSTQSSVLSQNSIIEYDGVYFWVGVDRFLMCDGSQVRELPNNMNINWFFDNLNFAQRQKVWAMKVPRYGEIHWYFPFGDATECTHCVIYNVRENTWYDNQCARSAGFYSQVFHYPIMTDSQGSATEQTLNLTGVTGTFAVGNTVSGGNGAQGAVTYVSGTTIRIHCLSNIKFVTGSLTDTSSGATATIASLGELFSSYVHEKGNDQLEGDIVKPIESWFLTSDFGYPTGGAQANQTEGLNRWTRMTRLETDFVQTGEMSVVVVGKEFANAPELASLPYNFTSETLRIDMREQRREIRLLFSSNVAGGHYEMGRPIMHLEPGDIRS